MTLQIQEIDLQTAEESTLGAVLEHRNLVDKEWLPEDPPQPLEELVAEIRGIESFRRRFCWALWESDRIVALANLRVEYVETNRNRAGFFASVVPQRRRSGLASALIEPVVERARKEERTLLDSWAPKGFSGEVFLDSIGAKRTQADFTNRVDIDQIDREMLQGWIRRASVRASDYSLISWEGSTPEDLLESFVELAHVMNTAPRPESMEDWVWTPERHRESERKATEVGWQHWTCVARHDPSGELAGYTDLWPSHFRPQFAYQGDTGVVPKHRNNGLGRWLKAVMMLKLLDERPETKWVETWNATVNEAMLAINNEMGFKPILEWSSYEIATDDLGKWLRDRPAVSTGANARAAG